MTSDGKSINISSNLIFWTIFSTDDGSNATDKAEVQKSLCTENIEVNINLTDKRWVAFSDTQKVSCAFPEVLFHHVAGGILVADASLTTYQIKFIH